MYYYKYLSIVLVFLYSCQMIGTQPEPTTSYEPRWMTQVERGDNASDRKHWQKAVKFYNEALDLIDDPEATPQPPSRSQIEEVIRLASYAQILASSGATRSLQSCDQMMRNEVRGIQITKHLMPVKFVFDSSNFTDKGQYSAQKLANCLVKKTKLYRITLVGHTDSKGDSSYNKQLSIKRAKALKIYLRKKGLALPIYTEGKGEDEPLQNIPNNLSQTEIDQMNRRVEIRNY